MKNIIDFLKNYAVEGSKYGLSRTRELIRLSGDPDLSLKIIHVAGSNGKGSLCEYLTRILLAAGKKTGSFTSPEVFSYCEKFALGGRPAERAVVEKYLSRAYELSLSVGDRPTAFEIETAAAFAMFAGEGCEYAVVECGMGGLNDSTNAAARKELCAISSVSLEHTAVLGRTVTEICRQKAGIIRDCPAVVSCLQTEEGLAYFRSLGVHIAGEGLEIVGSSMEGQRFRYRGKEYDLRMAGTAQAYNAATAVDCARLLGIGEDAIAAGLKEAKLKGRMQTVRTDGTTYVLDGSHNPASFSPLCEILKDDRRSRVLVFACLADKDVAAAAEILSSVFDRAYVFSPDSYRAMPLGEIYAAFSARFAQVTACASLNEALGRAKAELVAVCGTFTILKEAEQWIGKRQSGR